MNQQFSGKLPAATFGHRRIGCYWIVRRYSAFEKTDETTLADTLAFP
jgi:hypothetical protein